MTLQQIHYIIVIAETGSMNKAAEQLYIAQPSLTSAVKELEKEIGITIFNRSGKGVSLTADGTEFLVYARQLYQQYETLYEKYSDGKIKRKFGVSAQHYSFAVHAFVDGQVDALVGRTAFRRYAETGVQADTVARSGDGRVGGHVGEPLV